MYIQGYLVAFITLLGTVEMLAEPIKSSHEYQVIFVVAILCVYKFKFNLNLIYLIVNGLLMIKYIIGGVEVL